MGDGVIGWALMVAATVGYGALMTWVAHLAALDFKRRNRERIRDLERRQKALGLKS
jgi:hypothetical protein